LLDPVARIRAESNIHRAVEALDGPHQPQIPFLDQILEPEPLVQIAARDVDDQPQVGLHHDLARFGVAFRHSVRQFPLLMLREEGGLVDVLQIDLERRVSRLRASPQPHAHRGDLLVRQQPASEPERPLGAQRRRCAHRSILDP
jgi:hypothetical protein